MITVTVKRGPGDRPGQPITDPLIAGSEAAALARANAELDAGGAPRERVTLEIAPASGLAPGQLVEVYELDRPPWRGLITAIRMDIAAAPSNGAMTLTRTFAIDVEREDEL